VILTIVGARPQFIKAAVVSRALANEGIAECVVHTGQHYDENLSGVFWKELGLPPIFRNLEIGSDLQGKQTAKILEGIEALIIETKPEAVLLYGDTNSTLGGALAASKFPEITIVHIEAGLRSFNRSMPEEINRIVTDHLSTVLFCSSSTGVKHLASEGISDNVFDVGDVMYDSLNLFSSNNHGSNKWKSDTPFILLTIHRPVNTDSQENLVNILEAIRQTDLRTVWPVHPRNRAALQTLNLPQKLEIVPPASYFEMISLLNACEMVITDSGGLQKEAYWSRKRCVTVRTETEWVETLKDDANILTSARTEEILRAISKRPVIEWEKNMYGNGTASIRIAEILKKIL